MNTSRLTAMHINIIGASPALVVGLILFFFMIKPTQQQTETITTEAKGLEDGGGTDPAIAQSKGDLAKQKIQTKQINADWAVYSKKYMPDLNWKSDPLKTWEFVGYNNAGFISVPQRWSEWITQWYTAQID